MTYLITAAPYVLCAAIGAAVGAITMGLLIQGKIADLRDEVDWCE